MMRVVISNRDKLVWKALVALDQVVEQLGEAPWPDCHAVRFALAFLHAVGDGDRGGQDAF